MAVTEYATMHCVGGRLTADLRGILTRAYEAQDQWCAKNQPQTGSRYGLLFQQVEDEAIIFLTARWSSVAAHWEWIASDANKVVMVDLVPHVVMDGKDRVVMFHVDTEIFAEPEPEPQKQPGSETAASAAAHTQLMSSPIISVERMFVPAHQRADFAAKFKQVSQILADSAKPFTFRGGWRVDKEADEKHEFVLFSGWESLDQHTQFTQSAHFPRYAELAALTEGSEAKHYRRFL